MHGANFPLFFWIQFSYSNKRHQTLGYERKQGVPCDRLAGGFGNRPTAEFEHVQTVLCARCNGRVCFSGHGSQRTDFFFSHGPPTSFSWMRQYSARWVCCRLPSTLEMNHWSGPPPLLPHLNSTLQLLEMCTYPGGGAVISDGNRFCRASVSSFTFRLVSVFNLAHRHPAVRTSPDPYKKYRKYFN